VSSHDQKAGLGRQAARLAARAARAGQPAARVEAGAGPGVNGARSRVRRLLAGPRVRAVGAGHRGQFGRVSTGLVREALPAHGRRLAVLGPAGAGDGLVLDVTEVLMSFCVHRYGRRPARNRAGKALRRAARDAAPASPGVAG
jgi:putative resolvase